MGFHTKQPLDCAKKLPPATRIKIQGLSLKYRVPPPTLSDVVISQHANNLLIFVPSDMIETVNTCILSHCLSHNTRH